MSGVLRVRNWGKFQHYHTRRPPWIKLQHSLLDDYEFACLPIASKALASLLWLLASESNDGSIRDDAEWLAFRLHWSTADVELGLNPLIEHGFICRASGTLADCKQDATPEGEGEVETEKNMGQRAGPSADDLAFEEIQRTYPKREGSQRWAQARSGYRARLREKHTHAEMLAGVRRYAAYCDAKKITRTSLVLQAATFLGTNLGFTEPWTVTDVVRRDDLTRLTDTEIVSRCRAAGIGTAGLSRSELISRLAA